MRKNIMITYYKTENYPESKLHGIMSIEYPKEILNQDELVEAMLNNSPYMLEGNDFFVRRGIISHDNNVQKIRLDFFDDFKQFPILEDYLDNDKSDYRATLSDGVIIRMSNSDYERYLEKHEGILGISIMEQNNKNDKQKSLLRRFNK